MKITLEQFYKIFGKVNDAAVIVDELNEHFEIFKINTKQRIASFLSQVGHESGNFTARKENLNYSAKGLLAIFPKYFNATTAAQYERKPEKIANRVYADRMGNGNEASGDGYKFRGRGYIQLTGKNNYSSCGATLGKNLIDDPAYLETIEGAIASACWFWSHNKLNEVADKGSVAALTKRINGGTIGLEHRQELYNKAMAVL